MSGKVRKFDPDWRVATLSSMCKNLGRSTLYGLKYGLPKKLIWVGIISSLNLHD